MNFYCLADLLLYWFGFNQTCKSVVNFNVSKATESKLAKQELGWTEVSTAFHKVPVSMLCWKHFFHDGQLQLWKVNTIKARQTHATPPAYLALMVWHKVGTLKVLKIPINFGQKVLSFLPRGSVTLSVRPGANVINKF